MKSNVYKIWVKYQKKQIFNILNSSFFEEKATYSLLIPENNIYFSQNLVKAHIYILPLSLLFGHV